MGGIFNALTWWALSKALAIFTGAILMVVLIVGIVTSDVGSIALSWELRDLPQAVTDEQTRE